MDPVKTRGLWKYVVNKTKQINDIKKAAEKEEKRHSIYIRTVRSYHLLLFAIDPTFDNLPQRVSIKTTKSVVFPAIHKISLELEIPLIWSFLTKIVKNPL